VRTIRTASQRRGNERPAKCVGSGVTGRSTSGGKRGLLWHRPGHRRPGWPGRCRFARPIHCGRGEGRRCDGTGIFGWVGPVVSSGWPGKVANIATISPARGLTLSSYRPRTEPPDRSSRSKAGSWAWPASFRQAAAQKGRRRASGHAAESRARPQNYSRTRSSTTLASAS
jgi:hypothetical protein